MVGLDRGPQGRVGTREEFVDCLSLASSAASSITGQAPARDGRFDPNAHIRPAAISGQNPSRQSKKPNLHWALRRGRVFRGMSGSGQR